MVDDVLEPLCYTRAVIAAVNIRKPRSERITRILNRVIGIRLNVFSKIPGIKRTGNLGGKFRYIILPVVIGLVSPWQGFINGIVFRFWQIDLFK